MVDIAPLRVILPERVAGGIEHHDAARVGGVDAQVDRALGHAPDARVGRALHVVVHRAGELAVGQGAGDEVGPDQLGHQVGGVDHDLLGGLAHRRLDLVADQVDHVPAEHGDDQEVAEEDAQAEAHQPPSLSE
ncbi:hypothetical protein [Chitiniphilus shinanonensis]|uniref:hypothetical protein n=1 Tax=Chitiniphilus shinanonensis TaxID=553088 RepID=UPI001B7FB7B6|nr:hypothetical protein [Chitiniphilus shinanonensis]